MKGRYDEAPYRAHFLIISIEFLFQRITLANGDWANKINKKKSHIVWILYDVSRKRFNFKSTYGILLYLRTYWSFVCVAFIGRQFIFLFNISFDI